ncbi:hypothetical protein JX265_013770 [Neoarthrinium moseri]|uniref:RRM domain-containing protein n=1 Tax=Neoarthrinium moseri TaxID=1658444 RepID=A0A9Q0AHD6_9PEZI|nr:hypothetical protein JX266_009798 [Neoarthrinium moseri]KAI1848770.1 hypothetical protein JX265_013770 [Neoarthrinium moseri]
MAGPTKRRRDDGDDAELKKPDQPPTPASAQADDTEAKQPSSKRARVEAGKSLFVRSLPPSATDESLADFFSQHFPVKNALVVTDPATKQSRGYGFVVFTDAQDAVDARERLNGQKFDGRPINIDVAKSRDRKPGADTSQKDQRHAAEREARKPPKLIVRNLPWSIKKPDQLAALFRAYGKIIYCDLPQDKGKLSGFGFVTMKRKGAERAIEAVNGKVVDGRPLAVDWAVSKSEWTTQQQKEQAQDKAVSKSDKKAKKTKAANENDGSKETEDGEGDDKEKDENEDEDEDEEEDEDLRNFMKNFGDKLEDEEDSAAEDNELDPEGDDASDSDGDASNDEGDSDPAPKPLVTDNSSTIFIRNLPFSTTDPELKAHFESFGPVRYARVVMDRATDRPAGTGFVNFASLDDAKKCLRGAPRPRPADAFGKRSILQDESADQAGLYTLDGRVLQVSQAVSKDEATKLTEEGITARGGKDKDKRRLYLLAEGTISNDSPLYALLSPSEIKIREDSAAQRKKQIQSNPSLHLSLTRLAVRNIPRDLDSKALKALAREAVVGFATDVKGGRRQPLSKEEIVRGGEEDREAEHKRKEKGRGVVKQVKIVFENREGSKVTEGDGAGRSRGYGFIEYYSHRPALMALRWLNGHAVKNAAGKSHRLIVEFAIENAQVVARRNDRQTKFQHNASSDTNAQGQGRPQWRADGARSHGGRDGRKPGGPGKGAFGSRGQGAGQGPDKAVPEADGKDSKRKNAIRDTLEQKIIGRKRVMRKKKANARGKA